ncbi:hypothetical protein AVEN_189099-1 [Araneus ventricosus]|uniref:Uncharacterized protein n=1 Tax=Araneus ventricosus TaxID=182803 RepID=A0A4Y2HH30_ARAVE|nr:hypothetical protein AVEN_189099-1 [Araneus ventricosus]
MIACRDKYRLEYHHQSSDMHFEPLFTDLLHPKFDSDLQCRRQQPKFDKVLQCRRPHPKFNADLQCRDRIQNFCYLVCCRFEMSCSHTHGQTNRQTVDTLTDLIQNLAMVNNFNVKTASKI